MQATVNVIENGEYQVTVLPILEEVGILSGMEFSQIHNIMVEDVSTTTQGNRL